MEVDAVTTYLALHVICGLVALGYEIAWQGDPEKPTLGEAVMILLIGPLSLGAVLGNAHSRKH
jgi:hypothetical protein